MKTSPLTVLLVLSFASALAADPVPVETAPTVTLTLSPLTAKALGLPQAAGPVQVVTLDRAAARELRMALALALEEDPRCAESTLSDLARDTVRGSSDVYNIQPRGRGDE